MKVDYIIVGRGLAGSILAYMLHERGKKIILVSNDKLKSASLVAAGLYNPITGKRMSCTWKADILFPFIHHFYENLQKKLGVHFFYPKPIYIPFANIEEQNTWMAQSIQEEYHPFINSRTNNQLYSNYIFNEYGGFETRMSGYVDLPLMISAIKKHLTACCINADFYAHKIIFHTHACEWNNFIADKVIFCEGAYATKTPYFNWLPFMLSKGEVLSIHIRNFYANSIFNKGVFILPVGDDTYKAGSTYVWDFKDDNITEQGKKELCNKISFLIKHDFSIIQQEAGIRPTVKDRRPFLGVHPRYKSLAIFNGLGTKGVSLAPYFAQMMYAFLVENKNISKEVNIERYYSLYSYSD